MVRRFSQQALRQTKIDALAPERKGITDVYGLVFAPYASEDVFKREVALVNRMLDERFDAKGRVPQLLNHGATLQTHLWATPHNIVRAIEALASKMEIDAGKDDGFSNPQISVGASVKPLLDALEARLGRAHRCLHGRPPPQFLLPTRPNAFAVRLCHEQTFH